MSPKLKCSEKHWGDSEMPHHCSHLLQYYTSHCKGYPLGRRQDKDGPNSICVIVCTWLTQ